jgi:hypothetical protein
MNLDRERWQEHPSPHRATLLPQPGLVLLTFNPSVLDTHAVLRQGEVGIPEPDLAPLDHRKGVLVPTDKAAFPRQPLDLPLTFALLALDLTSSGSSFFPMPEDSVALLFMAYYSRQCRGMWGWVPSSHDAGSQGGGEQRRERKRARPLAAGLIQIRAWCPTNRSGLWRRADPGSMLSGQPRGCRRILGKRALVHQGPLVSSLDMARGGSMPLADGLSGKAWTEATEASRDSATQRGRPSPSGRPSRSGLTPS